MFFAQSRPDGSNDKTLREEEPLKYLCWSPLGLSSSLPSRCYGKGVLVPETCEMDINPIKSTLYPILFSYSFLRTKHFLQGYLNIFYGITVVTLFFLCVSDFISIGNGKTMVAETCRLDIPEEVCETLIPRIVLANRASVLINY